MRRSHRRQTHRLRRRHPTGATGAARTAAPQSRVLERDPRQCKRLRDEERIAQEREPRFRNELQASGTASAGGGDRRNAAEQRSTQLDRQWNENEQRIAEVTGLLREREGNLGELFGVTRQVAGDAATVIQQSLITTQYGTPTEGEERAEFLRRLAGARALPSITELERLWYELLREMTDSGKVDKVHQAFLLTNWTRRPSVDKEVVRVGPFTAADGKYLGYSQPQVAERAERGADRRVSRDRPRLQTAAPDGGYTSPSWIRPAARCSDSTWSAQTRSSACRRARSSAT